MELDFDTTEALGLDGTGRFTDRTFPFTVEGLRDHEVVLLALMASQADSYGDTDEVSCRSAAVYLDAAHAAVDARFGLLMENLSDYAVRYHASLEDLIESMQDDPHWVMDIIIGRRAF